MASFVLTLVLASLLAAGFFASERLLYFIPAYCVLALAGLVAVFPAQRKGRPALHLPSLIGSGLFFGYILTRACLSPAEYLARSDLFMVLGASIVYLLVATYFTSPKLRVVFVSVLLLLSCANCFVGAVQFFKGQNYMPFDFLSRPNYGSRASGFYGCPNHLAGLLEILMLMALSLTFWSRWRLPGKILAGYGAVVCGAGLLMTMSRGGWISTLAGLFVFATLSLVLASRWLRSDLWSLLAIFIVIVAVTLGFSVRSVIQSSDKLSVRVEEGTVGAPTRLALWKAALRQFELSPLLGTGSGTYLYYGRQFRDPIVQADPIYPHNDYLQLLAEYGIVGAAGFVIFLLCHLRSGWRYLREIINVRLHAADRSSPGFKGSNSLALTVGALSSVAAYCAHSAVDFNLHIPANTLTMAFVFGVLASPTIIPGPSAKPSGWFPNLPRFLKFVPAALGIWLAVSAVPTLPGEYYGEKARVALSDWRYIESPVIASAAEEAARKGLLYDAKNPTLYASLGDAQTALANMQTDPAERERLYRASIDAYQRALKLAPLDVNLVMYLGWSLDALEQFSESEAVFLRALELDPNSRETHWAHGAHLHRRKDYSGAQIEYEKALSLGSDAARPALQQLAEDVKKQASVPTVVQ